MRRTGPGFRRRRPAAAASGPGAMRNLLQHRSVGAEFGASGGELAGLEHVGHEVGRLLASELSRIVLGHRVLNLVDELRQRPAPDCEKASPARGGAFPPPSARRDRMRTGPCRRPDRAWPARRCTRRLSPFETVLTAPSRRAAESERQRATILRARRRAATQRIESGAKASIPPPISYATFWRSLSRADWRQANVSSLSSMKRTAKPNPGRT